MSCTQDTWLALPEWGSRDEFGFPSGPELSLVYSKYLCALKLFLKTPAHIRVYLKSGGGGHDISSGLSWLQAGDHPILESMKLFGDTAGHSG